VSGGAAAGIAIGCAVVGAAVVGLVCFFAVKPGRGEVTSTMQSLNEP
jgi:uncharacterized membrane protein YhiD involved in acid resistance